MRLSHALVAALLAAVVGCGGAVPSPAGGTPPRAGRFGSLRDFVLFERSVDGRQQDLFVDRFEVTRQDWLEFAGTVAGRAVAADTAALYGDPTLPVGRVDLVQARAFARWRFARLLRSDEWRHAAGGDGRNRFPWGSREDAARTNTAELGLGEPTPVGTFESGRRIEGDQPYDLVGNVSEWTESVPLSWCDEGLDPVGGFTSCRRRALAMPSLAVWQGVGGLLPAVFAVGVGGPEVPREVVGADFQTSMVAAVEAVAAGDRRLRTGLRLVATPVELLTALLRSGGDARPDDLEQVRRFCRRGRHRPVLVAAWAGPMLAAVVPAAPAALLRVLAEELGSRGVGAAAESR
jgi:hypothetical protein